MKLAYWKYVGPLHIGTLRVASSFKNVHVIIALLNLCDKKLCDVM
jgi:hypothetical protein